jgi:nitroreductase
MKESSRRRSSPGASASEVFGAEGSRPLTLDRRRFLIAMGSAAAYAALRPHLGIAAHAAQTSGLEPRTLPNDPPAASIDLARALIRASVLAPSHWNAQPWRFEVEGNSIRILADPTRALPVTDPDRRSMMIGLGAALENMLIAARAWGLQPSVEYFPSGAAHPVVAHVSWNEGEPHRDRGLFLAIPERRTNRRTFDGRGIYPQNRGQLLAQIPSDYALHWIEDRQGMRHIADIAHDASLAQDHDRRAAAEQGAWIRSDDGDARGHGDGVTVNALEVPGLAHWLPGRAFNPDSWFHRFGVESLARQTRDGLRSAGAIVLLTSSKRGEPVSLMAGQAFQRLSLRATELGIASQAISAPIEVDRYRADLLKSFSATGEEPLMLARLGHADAPAPSVRHNVSVVATFRNS